MLKADVNRIYDEEVYSEQKIREEKFFVRPTRQRKMKKESCFPLAWDLTFRLHNHSCTSHYRYDYDVFCKLCLCLLQSGRQLLLPCKAAHFAVIGVGIMFVLSFFNYNKLHKVAPVVLAISYLCLLVVLVLPGSEGVKRWIPLGIFNIQPSEIAKFAIILSFHIGAVNTIIKCSLPVTAFCRV